MEKALWFSLLQENGYDPYEASARVINETLYVMVKRGYDRFFAVAGQDDAAFSGTVLDLSAGFVKLCPLTRENCAAMQAKFPYTVPTSLHGKNVTIGLGERLGLCSGAHIRALAGTSAFPVLAQQSKRELSLTGRSNRKMMDDVAWQVFQAGYEGGYAADGDHRKTLEEVLDAVSDGVTMITLDCSDHIDNQAHTLASDVAENACREKFSAESLQTWKDLYCGKEFPVANSQSISFAEDAFWQMLLTYGEAIAFAKEVYEKAIVTSDHPVSFEVSIDETETTTEPCAHYFMAAELIRLGVTVDSMAPRFYGEFQKGVDYIGELDRFESEFCTHVAIADFFGYRISVHSGSDKFSVFPCVGKESGYRFHLKTSGTTWVEAVRVIATCDPALFRRMAKFSCKHFAEALKYYHVSAQVSRVPDMDTIADADLPALMDEVDTRQVMHITYGFLLQAENEDGSKQFADDIYRVLRDNQEKLDNIISRHIRKHLIYLGITEA